MKLRTKQKSFSAAIPLLALSLASSPAIAGQVTGAIFTTDRDSNFVNANVYDTAATTIDLSKTAPYLNGGPRPNAPCSAAGLPDGSYYFQVTDPSGKVLLSLDPISNRGVMVAGGLIVGLNSGSTHDMGMGKCMGIYTQNITVELFPFFRTPNPGGEYKVWMTKDYVTCAINEDPNSTSTTPCQGSFGFIPSLSKTDNFKVVDYDGDGIPDGEDNCPDVPDTTNQSCMTPDS
ncbi:MAG: thrombospondin type 3 repeat-containing protein [Candidatus Binatia bacterium]